MNRLAVLGLTGGLILANSAPLQAGNGQLKGTFASGGSVSCLTAPGGFNSVNQPNNPAAATVSITATQTTRTYDGQGNGTSQSSNLSSNFAASAANMKYVPNASVSTTSGTLTYHVAGNGTVTLTETNEQGTVLDGVRAGQTFAIDQFDLAGTLAQRGKALALATPQTAVETITYSNGDSFPRICHRAATSVQVSP